MRAARRDVPCRSDQRGAARHAPSPNGRGERRFRARRTGRTRPQRDSVPGDGRGATRIGRSRPAAGSSAKCRPRGIGLGPPQRVTAGAPGALAGNNPARSAGTCRRGCPCFLYAPSVSLHCPFPPSPARGSRSRADSERRGRTEGQGWVGGAAPGRRCWRHRRLGPWPRVIGQPAQPLRVVGRPLLLGRMLVEPVLAAEHRRRLVRHVGRQMVVAERQPDRSVGLMVKPASSHADRHSATRTDGVSRQPDARVKQGVARRRVDVLFAHRRSGSLSNCEPSGSRSSVRRSSSSWMPRVFLPGWCVEPAVVGAVARASPSPRPATSRGRAATVVSSMEWLARSGF